MLFWHFQHKRKNRSVIAEQRFIFFLNVKLYSSSKNVENLCVIDFSRANCREKRGKLLFKMQLIHLNSTYYCTYLRFFKLIISLIFHFKSLISPVPIYNYYKFHL